MSYLGTGVTQGTVELDSFTGNGSTTDFTLTGAPVGVDGLLVSLDGVVQDPGEWSLSGTTLSFSTAPHSSGDIRVWNLAISASAISDDAVTLAKMAGGTDGNIISYDASGNPVAIATGDDGEVLTSAGEGQPPAFEAAGGGYTEGCRVHATAAQAIPNDAFTDLNFQSERYDTDTMADQTDAGTNIKITFTTAGVYVVWGGFRWTNDGTTSNSMSICLNGTTTIAYVRNDPSDGLWMATIATLWTFDAADYVTLQARQETGSPLNTYVPVGGDVSTHQYAPEFAAQRIG